jgi:hypothetical protein
MDLIFSAAMVTLLVIAAAAAWPAIVRRVFARGRQRHARIELLGRS